VGQLLLVAASAAIPRVLGWREEIARSLRPLTRNVFWTWGAYIWLTHLAFGLLSALAPELLTDGSPLARIACAFIAAWWGARLILQFTYFDRRAAPPGWIYKAAEAALVALFAALACVYAWVAFASARLHA
jgi:hypothetical protein